mgnify:CR=1 FL=1|jgi:hypothetical protein
MKKDAPNAEEKVRAIKEQIVALGPMRPGKLSVQYHKPIEKAQAFYQISYTIQKRSRSDYVREADLERVKAELENYQTFKRLCEELVVASLALAKSRRR